MNGEPLLWAREHASHDGAECLIWPFGRASDGYGVLCAGGEKDRELAHRWMCREAHGPAPSDEHQAAHSCGNGGGGCVNPSHLRWATPAENSADSREHGTLSALRYKGEDHPSAQLSAEDVISIKERLARGERITDLAREFGMSHGSISDIKHGRTWRELRAA